MNPWPVTLTLVLATAGCSSSTEPTTTPPEAAGPAQTWSTLRGNAQRNGRSAATGPESPSVLWSYPSDAFLDGFYLPPALMPDGSLVVPADDGTVFALNSDGSLRWTRQLMGRIQSGPTIDELGRVLLGVSDTLVCLSSDGDTLWEFSPAAGGIEGTAIGQNGEIYVAVEQAGLVSLDPGGRRRWVQPAVGAKFTPAVRADGSVIATDNTGRLFAVDPEGALLWEAPLPDPDNAVPAIGAGGGVYVVGSYEVLHALDAEGAERWSLAVADDNAAGLAIGQDETLYVLGGSTWGRVVAVDGAGTEQWELAEASGQAPPVVDQAGTLYTATDTELLAVHPDGSIKWRLAVPGNGVILGADGTLYVISGHGVTAVN